MKNYIPEAKFDPFDEPVGDKRWWYERAYKQLGHNWEGPESDLFSPHTRTEELEINNALLEGKILPRNESEQRYLDFMGGVSPVNERPWKWVTCRRCGSEWKTRGYPAGEMPMTAERISGRRWLFAQCCNLCGDKYMAKPKPEVKEEPKQQSFRNVLGDDE